MQVFFVPDVDDFIFHLNGSHSSKVKQFIDLLREYGSQLRFPYSRKITRYLFELRIRTNPPIRIIYYFSSSGATLLHAFFKKTQKTPIKELKLAEKRFKELTI
jgi:phage-related protein